MWKFPFLIITTCMVAGILLGHYLLPFKISFIVCLITVIAYSILTLFKISHRCVQFILIISLSAAACIRYHLSGNYLPGNHLAFTETNQIESIEGRVLEVHRFPDEKWRIIVAVSHFWQNSLKYKTKGNLLVMASKISRQAEYGNSVHISGKIERIPQTRNPGQFDYNKYLSRQDIYHRIYIDADSNFVLNDEQDTELLRKIFVESLRNYCHSNFSEYFDEPAESVAYALFLGEKQGLDKETVSQFKRTGVIHILAISGLHVGFIIVFVLALSSLLRLTSSYRISLLIGVLLVYVILINLRPPVIRAAFMAVLFLLAPYIQRKVNVYNVILAAAFVILLSDPRELFNPGFQFSFVAVLSITNGYEALNRLFPVSAWIKKMKDKKRIFHLLLTWIWIPFLVSCSATIGTLPLTWYYYGFIPLYAILANLIVIPLTGVLVLLIIFLLLFVPLSSYIASGIAGLFSIVYRILSHIVSGFSGFPFASIECAIPSSLFIIGLLISIFLLFNIHVKIARGIFLPLFSTLIILIIMPDPPRSALRVAFLDVGQGDAAVLEFPDRKTMLIDAGSSDRFWDNGSQVVIPYLQNRKIRHLNYVVLSHPHNDHIAGMISVLKNISVDTVVTTEYDYHSRTYRVLLKFCTEQKIPLRYVKKGDMLYPDSTCRAYILHPDAQFFGKPEQDGGTCNNSSIVLKIVFGKNSLLFTGDSEIKAEKSIMAYGEFLKSEILKIGHHGSITSTSVQILNEIQPICAVISVAEKNHFSHPSPVTVLKLTSSTPKIYQTKNSRAVIFEIFPEKIKKIAW